MVWLAERRLREVPAVLLWGQGESASWGRVCCGRGFYAEVVHSSGGRGMTSGTRRQSNENDARRGLEPQTNGPS
jgi:hypothetical protein